MLHVAFTCKNSHLKYNITILCSLRKEIKEIALNVNTCYNLTTLIIENFLIKCKKEFFSDCSELSKITFSINLLNRYSCKHLNRTVCKCSYKLLVTENQPYRIDKTLNEPIQVNGIFMRIKDLQTIWDIIIGFTGSIFCTRNSLL